MTKKSRQIFFQEKIGWQPSVAAPGDTNPSDATGQKWKTGTERQYFTDIIGLSSATVTYLASKAIELGDKRNIRAIA